MTLRPPRAIIFDWDNTLVDTWVCIRAAFNATLRAMDRPEWDLDETKQRLGLSLRDSFPGLFGDRWEEARDIFYSAFQAIHLEQLRPLPGAGEMLQCLSGLGVRLGIVSNKNGNYLRAEVRHLAWEAWFDRVVGATDADQDKPAVAPVLLALQASGIAPGEDVWFVGDAAVDMECAVNSGCVPILLRSESARNGEFDRHPPRRHVAGCGEFAALVRELVVPIAPN